MLSYIFITRQIAAQHLKRRHRDWRHKSYTLYTHSADNTVKCSCKPDAWRLRCRHLANWTKHTRRL